MVDDVSGGTGNGTGIGILHGKFHPDGLILATSIMSHINVTTDDKSISNITATDMSQNYIKIYDVREQNNVATFTDHKGQVRYSNDSIHVYIYVITILLLI